MVIAAGTFLRGRLFRGRERWKGGRIGDISSDSLEDDLMKRMFHVKRYKTGTPPRIVRSSVDTDRMDIQEEEAEPFTFSFRNGEPSRRREWCYTVRTGSRTRETALKYLDSSPMFAGEIEGRGPRYCPSFEDKVVKFPDADRHQVFLEPEGLETTELYVNGLSTSLPAEVQRRFLRAVPGLERATMTQPGYAIEYDYFSPERLAPTLALPELPGLWLAGQINGTTGYEEAAGQGVVAGINAALAVQGRESWVPARDEAYLGVLVDDLVTRGVDEPYRLFTSRAEFRLTLRQDNCLVRLGPVAERLGLLTDDESRKLDQHRENIEKTRRWVAQSRLRPEEINPWLETRGTAPIPETQPLVRLLRRPEVTLESLLDADGPLSGQGLDSDACTTVEMETKYAGYIARDRERAESLKSREQHPLPPDADYLSFGSVSWEARQKLQRVRPASLGQAARIPGVSPSDLQNLLVEIRKQAGAGVARETASPPPTGEPA
jgi:tRNA uridine 5-carboxymethylaminomethyl modification enzyme